VAEAAMAEEGMSLDSLLWPCYEAIDYQLLDFGGGRRLERFGAFTLDRPCPSAEPFQPAKPELWPQADARFDGRDQEKGQWTDRSELPERWTVACGLLRFELKRTDFGHLGLFPEQADNWVWIASVLPSPFGRGAGGEGGSGESHGPHPLPLSQRERGVSFRILNLFAYTGGSTLAAAAAGAEVTHVDAARNVVAWARRNAELSGLADAPIRWIAEDATKFVKRELKRGNRYDAVIFDPPSYGHGPRGEVWRLSKHLPRLLDLCAELTGGRPQFMLLTCHTPGYDAETLGKMLRQSLGDAGAVQAEQLTIRCVTGRELPGGVVARFMMTEDRTKPSSREPTAPGG
jgi:23S rRNA (cytosine1962-C5)-methyltransferase